MAAPTSTPARVLRPFLALAPALRGAGFAAAPEQSASFLAAVGLLGPGSIHDIRRAARAIFGPGPDRVALFDQIFDAVFLGQSLDAPFADGPEADLPPALDADGLEQLFEPDDDDPSGQEATLVEKLFQRRLAATKGPVDFARALPASLPRRKSRRFQRAGGNRPDPARAFRQMLRRDGEITRLPARARRMRQRRVLLLIDISGSMKAGTDGALRLAHQLMRGAEQAEVFTLGTRLTRVSRALRLRDEGQALAQVSGLVADWDGGTRLGEALAAFLSVPRFAAFARGALVIVLSDGLERGGPDALASAMARLRGLARYILWLTPLASDPGYRPETAAMQAVLPYLDALGDGSAPGPIARDILEFGRAMR